MQALRTIFSPSGRLSPQAFVVAAVAVYAAGVAAQWLTIPEILVRAGIWPFAIAQALLIWIWYALHAKRLRDAGRSADFAAGAALLYALSIVLLLIVATSFFKPHDGGTIDPNATAALNLILLVSVIAALAHTSGQDIGALIVTILVILAFLPVIVAVAVTLWAATRQSIAEQST
jgi:uncharacterized membrane protein YhaH (DUF805 family)